MRLLLNFTNKMKLDITGSTLVTVYLYEVWVHWKRGNFPDKSFRVTLAVSVTLNCSYWVIRSPMAAINSQIPRWMSWVVTTKRNWTSDLLTHAWNGNFCFDDKFFVLTVKYWAQMSLSCDRSIVFHYCFYSFLKSLYIQFSKSRSESTILLILFLNWGCVLFSRVVYVII